MKKSIRVTRKLVLRQETLRDLAECELAEVRGGAVASEDVLNTCPVALVVVTITIPCTM